MFIAGCILVGLISLYLLFVLYCFKFKTGGAHVISLFDLLIIPVMFIKFRIALGISLAVGVAMILLGWQKICK